mmetsp:Transcript_1711/g.4803  ORF Transcript_1711/g.4803 Transcript_1711/m.4803 type:complete len:224 (-) Transcript_1711:228-899(-)
MSSPSAAYTIWCRLRLRTPEKASLSISRAKWLSPAKPRAPAWPACWSDSSISWRWTGLNSDTRLASIREPIGPSAPPAHMVVGTARGGGGGGSCGGVEDDGGGGERSAESESAAALRFIVLSMLRKPLFRPGVSDCESPEYWMNSGCTAWICSFVQPSRPFTRRATRPLVSCASDSPTNRILSPSSRVACTCTVDRHPGTLFASTCSALSIGGSFLARKSSCW